MIEQLAQDHTANKWRSQDSNPARLALESMLLTTGRVPNLPALPGAVPVLVLIVPCLQKALGSEQTRTVDHSTRDPLSNRVHCHEIK